MSAGAQMPSDAPLGPQTDANVAAGLAADAVANPAEVVAWRRLSLRMLAVHPVMELIRALPAVAALLILGSQQDGGGWWAYFGVGVPVLIGLIRWATTRYRISPTQVQVRRGLLGRSVRTVPRDRIRSVDLTSHLMHRLLGLTKMAIGTGQVDSQKESGLVLDGLSTRDAASLREELLHSRSAARALVTESAMVHRLTGETMLARLDPRWIRYGPFTLSGLVTIGVTAAFSWRTINEAHLNPDQFGPLHALTGQLGSLPLGWAAAEVALIALLLVAAASTVTYVLAFWNFLLTRTVNGTLHVSRGLLTKRSTTIEERRLRGVEINEPLLLRWVGGARTAAITTGLRYGRGTERGGSLLLPPAPATQARRVGGHVLHTEEPLVTPLVAHSAAAGRRRYTRALLGAAILVGLVGLLSWALSQPVWVLTAAVVFFGSAVALAWDRYRNLGHAVVDNRVVFQVGSAVRRRYVIDREGVIGWKIKQSFFQRRAGLVTLTATTAAGRQHYTLPDIDTAAAVELADTVLPALLTPFLAAPSREFRDLGVVPAASGGKDPTIDA